MDRRRTPRYVLETPLRGNAMPMEDVTVEQCSDARVVVISPSAHQPEEELMIHMATPAGLQSRGARVLSSTPVSVAGALCFRIELRVDDVRAQARGEESGEDSRGEH